MSNTQIITPPHSHSLNVGISPTSNRLREFDAMRGFSMFLVVVIHVMLNIGMEGSSTVFGNFICSFRLPLFFFVSGFFSWRPLDKWTRATTKRVTTQKFRAQIICAILFYALLSYSRGTNLFGWLNNGFGAYWFTGVLFLMYIAYLISVAISRLCRRDYSLVIMTIFALFGIILIATHNYPNNRLWTIINGTNLCLFLQYYVAGMFYRKYKNQIGAFLNRDIVKALLMVGFIVIFCLGYLDYVIQRPMLNLILSSEVITYVGVFMIVSLFDGAKDYFQKNNVVSNTLCKIGQRSLDVYMMHYFFLPSLLFLGPWLSTGNTVLFQIVISATISLAVIGICLLLSNCLRQSHFLAVWLFGVRRA